MNTFVVTFPSPSAPPLYLSSASRCNDRDGRPSPVVPPRPGTHWVHAAPSVDAAAVITVLGPVVAVVLGTAARGHAGAAVVAVNVAGLGIVSGRGLGRGSGEGLFLDIQNRNPWLVEIVIEGQLQSRTRTFVGSFYSRFVRLWYVTGAWQYRNCDFETERKREW